MGSQSRIPEGISGMNYLYAIEQVVKRRTPNDRYYVCLDKSFRRIAVADSRELRDHHDIYEKLSIEEIAVAGRKAIDNLRAHPLPGSLSHIERISKIVPQLAQERANQGKYWRILGIVLGILCFWTGLGTYFAIKFGAKQRNLDKEASTIKTEFEKQFFSAAITDIHRRLVVQQSEIVEHLKQLKEQRKNVINKAVANYVDGLREESKKEGRPFFENLDIRAAIQDIKKQIGPQIKQNQDQFNKTKEVGIKALQEGFGEEFKKLSEIDPPTEALRQGSQKLQELCAEQGLKKSIDALTGTPATVEGTFIDVLKAEGESVHQQMENALNVHQEAWREEAELRDTVIAPALHDLQTGIREEVNTLVKSNQSPFNDLEALKPGESPYKSVKIQAAVRTAQEILQKRLKESDARLEALNKSIPARVASLSEFTKAIDKICALAEQLDAPNPRLKEIQKICSAAHMKQLMEERAKNLLGLDIPARLLAVVGQQELLVKPELGDLVAKRIPVQSPTLNHFETFGQGYYLKGGVDQDQLDDTPIAGSRNTVQIPHDGMKDLQRGFYGTISIHSKNPIPPWNNATARNVTDPEIGAYFNRVQEVIGPEAMQRLVFFHMQGGWAIVCETIMHKLNPEGLSMGAKYNVSELPLNEMNKFRQTIDIDINENGDMRSVSKMVLNVHSTDSSLNRPKCYVVVTRSVEIGGELMRRKRGQPLTEADMKLCSSNLVLSPFFSTLQEAAEWSEKQAKASQSNLI